MKKVSLVLILTMILVLMSGCATTATTTAAAAEATAAAAVTTAAPAAEEIYIPLIAKGFQHQYWKACEEGAKAAAAELGVKITYDAPNSESEFAVQADQVAATLGKNPSAIAIAPLDSKTLLPYVEKAKEMGIPVVLFDAPMDSDIPVSMVATDSMVAGAYAADMFAKAVGGKGEVAIISNSQSSANHVNRRDGFANQITAKYPDIKIVAVEYSDGGDNLKAADAAKAIMSANPNLNGFYSTGEGNSNGIYNALKETNTIGKYVCIGFDAGKLQKEAVRSGAFLGAISQDPYNIGYLAVKTAYAAIKGEAVEKNVDTGFKWYDSTNVDSKELAMLLYD